MIVHRIEGSCGDGIYQAMEQGEIHANGRISIYVHPMPWNDGIPEFSDDEFFGFESEQSLRDWFDDHCLKNIADNDGVYCQYEVCDSLVRIGGR